MKARCRIARMTGAAGRRRSAPSDAIRAATTVGQIPQMTIARGLERAGAQARARGAKADRRDPTAAARDRTRIASPSPRSRLHARIQRRGMTLAQTLTVGQTQSHAREAEADLIRSELGPPPLLGAETTRPLKTLEGIANALHPLLVVEARPPRATLEKMASL